MKKLVLIIVIVCIFVITFIITVLLLIGCMIGIAITKPEEQIKEYEYCPYCGEEVEWREVR